MKIHSSSPIIFLYAILLALFVALFFSLLAAGASCEEPGSPDVEFGEAAAVFSGRVLYISSVHPRFMDFVNRTLIWLGFHPIDYYEQIFPGRRVIFEVKQSWKGIETTTVQIRTGYTTANSSGYPFIVGHDYLVYASHAYGDPDKYLLTSLCARTTELSSASVDLAYLNTRPTLPLRFAPPSIYILSAIFFTLIMLLAGFIYIRYRRKKLMEAGNIVSE